jgi:hypothetical protein
VEHQQQVHIDLSRPWKTCGIVQCDLATGYSPSLGARSLPVRYVGQRLAGLCLEPGGAGHSAVAMPRGKVMELHKRIDLLREDE